MVVLEMPLCKSASRRPSCKNEFQTISGKKNRLNHEILTIPQRNLRDGAFYSSYLHKEQYFSREYEQEERIKAPAKVGPV